MDNVQESKNHNNNKNTSSCKMDLNSEPKNITRVRSRSSRLPMELQHHTSTHPFSFGDGGLGRRQTPSNILNSPDTNDTDYYDKKSLDGIAQQHHNRHYWSGQGQEQAEKGAEKVFPVKVGRSPINQMNNNNNNSDNSTNAPSLTPMDQQHQLQHPRPTTMGVVENSHSLHSMQLEAFNRQQQQTTRVVKDTAEILESPTTTDPELYLRNSLEGRDSEPSECEATTSPDAEPSNVDSLRRMIGGVQIADYEGSPRRFGAQSGSGSYTLQPHRITTEVGKSPSPLGGGGGGFRPGFPQRVLVATTPEPQPEKCDRGKEEVGEGDDAVSFDYVYEFSETRKVLNEFFDKAKDDKAQNDGQGIMNVTGSGSNSNRERGNWSGGLIGLSPEMRRRRGSSINNNVDGDQQQQQQPVRYQESSQDLMFLDVLSQDGDGDQEMMAMDAEHIMRNSKNFTLSPETTDYDSNCGDLDSFSNDLSTGPTDYGRLYTVHMPVLEDGLSSGHASDAESHHHQQQQQQLPIDAAQSINGEGGDEIVIGGEIVVSDGNKNESKENAVVQSQQKQQNVNEALKEIQTAIQRVKVLSQKQTTTSVDGGQSPPPRSPIWVPRLQRASSQESLNSEFNVMKEGGAGIGIGEDDELDTDLETDRLLGQQRLEDHFYEEDNNWVLRNKLNLKGTTGASSVSSAIRHDTGSTLLPGSPTESRAGGESENGSPQREGKSPTGSADKAEGQGEVSQQSSKARNKEGM